MNRLLGPDRIIWVKVSLRYYKVNTLDILYVEAEKDYAQIYTKTKNFRIHSTIKQMIEKLPAGKFLQVHRSFIIRLDAITEINGTIEGVVINGKNIPVGNTFRKELRSKLEIIDGELNTQH